jgi:hypothetical protein
MSRVRQRNTRRRARRITPPRWLRFDRRGDETYAVMTTESGVTELWM